MKVQSDKSFISAVLLQSITQSLAHQRQNKPTLNTTEPTTPQSIKSIEITVIITANQNFGATFSEYILPQYM